MLGLEALFPWKGSEKNMGHGSSIPIRQIILRPDVNLALMARDDHGLTAENSGSPVGSFVPNFWMLEPTLLQISYTF